MLPGTVWGFLTALLIVLVGAYLLDLDWPLPTSGSKAATTLLCAGGSGAPCCREDDRSEHTSGLAITIDRQNNKVNIFSEAEGSANGEIIEDEESHLLFGKKCATGTSKSASTGASTSTGTGGSTGTSAAVSTGPSAGTSTGPSTGTGTSTNPVDGDKCRVADGEINRLTGVANIAIMDGKGQPVVVWTKIECKRRSRRF